MNDARARLPPQIAFIIGNEACERFSFYGMRNILTAFLTGYLFVDMSQPEREAGAKEVFHLFVMGVYFFPVLGGWISDRFWGKYRTIFWLSLVYSVGQACLAAFVTERMGVYAGLLLIAVGSGGIKPCVSSFVGDQFDRRNAHLAKLVFDAFYWIINFGSFFASLFIPKALTAFGPSIAFAIPGALMIAATVVFWLGRHRYVNVPPSRGDGSGFLAICRDAIFSTGLDGRQQGAMALAALALVGAVASLGLIPWLGIVPAVCLSIVVFLGLGGLAVTRTLDRARGAHDAAAVDGVRAVLRVLVLFALVTPFWSLFDQKASTWVIQGQALVLPGWSWFSSPSQMQAINPALVMVIIPFNNLALFPVLRRLGVEPTPLRRMAAGITFAGLAWIAVALLQVELDRGARLSILWQLVPYALLTFGEVLVSATGLEFAYSQAPAKMKSVIMSAWMLTTTIGNLWVLLVNATVRRPEVSRAITAHGHGVIATQMFFFAGFAFVAALVFALYARSYRMADHYREA